MPALPEHRRNGLKLGRHALHALTRHLAAFPFLTRPGSPLLCCRAACRQRDERGGGASGVGRGAGSRQGCDSICWLCGDSGHSGVGGTQLPAEQFGCTAAPAIAAAELEEEREALQRELAALQSTAQIEQEASLDWWWLVV